MTELQQFLAPTDTLEVDHPRIRALVEEQTADASDVRDAARRLFEVARDAVAYSPYVPFWDRSHYRTTTILDRGRGYCVQKAMVLVTLARAARIPARLVFVDLRNHRAPAHLVEILQGNLFVYHCYASLLLEGEWLEATPAFDRAICEEHDLPLVRFDGHRSAIFPSEDHAGRRFAEYVKHHGAFADVPMGPMLAAWDEAYGADRVAQWRALLPLGKRWE
ncbi:MAG: transglutaminase-like domain-containing protein [bacterium]